MSTTKFPFDVPALCALPWVRRCYQALVAALAVFILTLVIWREPFRGYLAEVHLSGPQAEGIDLNHAVNWIKQNDKRVAAVATAAGEISTKPQIRATYLALTPRLATEHLDGLAERFLFQYLPDRLQNYRHTALTELRNASQAAREREDTAHFALETLRQKQLALVLKTAGDSAGKLAAVTSNTTTITASPAPGIAANSQRPESPRSTAALAPNSAASSTLQMPSDMPDGRAKTFDKLHLLRLELAGLLANCTDQHPDVITLRSQIDAIERELGIHSGTREAAKVPPAIKQASGEMPLNVPTLDGITTNASDATKPLASPSPQQSAATPAATAAQLETPADEATLILQEVALASRERQAAERRLSERMQELTNQPAAAQWSAAPAHLVTRIGGTPRTHTLALASILATFAGVVIFRAAANDGCAPRIDSAGLLASTLELPVVGNLLAMRDAARQMRRQWLPAARLNWFLHGSEIVIALAVLACLGSIACEPSLARQVLADPFGTLSEVMGRIGS